MILLLVISVFGNTITDIIKRHIVIPGNITNLLEMKNLIMFVVLMVEPFFLDAFPIKMALEYLLYFSITIKILHRL